MTLQETKKALYALRNGIMADYMRKAGDEHPYIFGVTLAQIIDLAKSIGQDAALARQLWSDAKCRESQMLAPIIMPAQEVDEDEARTMVIEIPNVEIADIACHRLLRNLPCAETLAHEIATSEEPLQQYIALRLLVNLDSLNRLNDRAKAIELANSLPSTPLLSSLKQSLLEE